MSPTISNRPVLPPSQISATSKANTELLRQQHDRADRETRALMEQMIAEHMNRKTPAQYEAELQAQLAAEQAAVQRMEEEAAGEAAAKAEKTKQEYEAITAGLLGEQGLNELSRKERIEALRGQV